MTAYPNFANKTFANDESLLYFRQHALMTFTNWRMSYWRKSYWRNSGTPLDPTGFDQIHCRILWPAQVKRYGSYMDRIRTLYRAQKYGPYYH